MPTTEEKAKAEYRTATPAAKKVLETIFGAELFAGKIQDRVNSFETAYPIFMKRKFKDASFNILQKRAVKDMLTEVGGAHQTFLRNPLTEIV